MTATSRWLAAAVAAIGVGTGCGTPSPEPIRDLVFWTTPVDAPDSTTPPEVAEQIEFFEHLPQYFQRKYEIRLSSRIHVTDVRGKTRNDPEFARQVLGQRLFLRELSRFIDQQPGVRGIEVKFLKWEELLSALEDLKGDPEAAPDVTIVPSSWLAYLARDVLARLDRGPGAVATAGFVDEALRTCRTSDGALYALPWIIDLRFFFYWKDLFPPGAAFANRAQLARAIQGSKAQQLERRGTTYKPPFVLPTDVDWDILHLFSLFLWNSGGDWRSWRVGWRDGGLGVLSSDDAANAVSLMKELNDTDAVAFLQVKRNDLEGRFVNQEIASVLAGPWLIRRLQEKYATADEWFTHVGVALPPLNESGTAITFLGGSHLGATRKAARDQLAKDLIAYVTTQSAKATAPENLTIPAADDARKVLLASFPPESPMRELIPKAIAHSRAYPPLAEWPQGVELELSRIRLPLLFMHVAERESSALVRRDLAEIRSILRSRVVLEPLQWRVTAAAVCIAVALVYFVLWRRARRHDEDTVRALREKDAELRAALERPNQAFAGAKQESGEDDAPPRGRWLLPPLRALLDHAARQDFDRL